MAEGRYDRSTHPSKQLEMKLELMSAMRLDAFQSNQPHVNEYPVDVFGKRGSISAVVIKLDMSALEHARYSGTTDGDVNRHRRWRPNTYIPKRDTSPGRNLCFERGTDESFIRDVAAI